MSKYTLGVDLANDSDYMAYTFLRHKKIPWYHFWLKRLHLIKHLPAPYEIVDMFTKPNSKGGS